MTAARSEEAPALRVCIVGSGTQFVSGVSYYTYFLVDTFAKRYETSVVLMRNLVPRRFYPGRDRVGTPITDLHASKICPAFDGVDWFAIPSLPRAGRFLRQQKPEVIVFQWWTGAVLPAFLYLLAVARRGGAKVILEFHEDQDTGEASLPLVERIVRPGLRRLILGADHFVVHSEWDRNRLCEKFCLEPSAVSVIPVGPFEVGGEHESPARAETGAPSQGSDETITVMFFGTIRPYKGVEDLIDAFELLPRRGRVRWRLLVVGETWEGWDLPERKIRSSPFAAGYRIHQSLCRRRRDPRTLCPGGRRRPSVPSVLGKRPSSPHDATWPAGRGHRCRGFDRGCQGLFRSRVGPSARSTVSGRRDRREYRPPGCAPSGCAHLGQLLESLLCRHGRSGAGA